MKAYNDYNSYLKKRFGCRVYKIGIDAGFSCPNRDGTKGSGGCIYCNYTGSRSGYTKPGETVEIQLASRISYMRERYSAEKFIAYFQAFTNTYASLDNLKDVYDRVLPFKEIVGLSIGTRSDCVDREKIDLIASYKDRYDVWIEYGLQSFHDRTLKTINRGHDIDNFTSAFELAKKAGVSVCVHVILGLPGETRLDMTDTARRLSEINPDGVKIHLLHVLRGSPLEELYQKGGIRLLEQEEYAGLVCDFLENLSPEIIIQRLTGEGKEEDHLAPLWALDKLGTIDKIKRTMIMRGTHQGSAITAKGDRLIS